MLAHSRLGDKLKTFKNVIRGFALFAAAHPGATLDVVGEEPPLEELAKEQGIAGSVHFHGYLKKDELDAVYAACDVFAMRARSTNPSAWSFPKPRRAGFCGGPDAVEPSRSSMAGVWDTRAIRFLPRLYARR